MAARGVSASEIKAKTGLSGSAARNVVSNWSPAGQAAHQAAAAQATADAAAAAQAAADAAAAQAAADAAAQDTNTYAGLGVSLPELQAAQTAAELQTRSQISNYGWDAQKAMENIRQAAETERLKYEVDNRIPVVQAEAKGKIDLQKIVNAGLQNVTRIERGADMMRSITSMFNF